MGIMEAAVMRLKTTRTWIKISLLGKGITMARLIARSEDVKDPFILDVHNSGQQRVRWKSSSSSSSSNANNSNSEGHVHQRKCLDILFDHVSKVATPGWAQLPTLGSLLKEKTG